MQSIRYRSLNSGEEPAAARMVAKVFFEWVAPGYSLAGILEFLSFAAPGEMRRRREAGGWQFVAEYQEQLVGLAEVREGRHLALLFVDSNWRRRGIAKALLEEAKNYCRANNRVTLTVNSSPYAVPFYRSAGFVPFVEEQERNGIRYLPMALSLSSQQEFPV